jgi:hypothetical protein
LLVICNLHNVIFLILFETCYPLSESRAEGLGARAEEKLKAESSKLKAERAKGIGQRASQ